MCYHVLLIAGILESCLNMRPNCNDKNMCDCSLQLFPCLSAHVAQSVICLATDASLTADPGVASSIQPGPILLWRLIMK